MSRRAIQRVYGMYTNVGAYLGVILQILSATSTCTCMDSVEGGIYFLYNNEVAELNLLHRYGNERHASMLQQGARCDRRYRINAGFETGIRVTKRA